MRDFLVKEWKLQYEAHIFPLNNWTLMRNQRGLKAVLHDRPPAHFHATTAFETHEVTKTLLNHLAIYIHPSALPSHSLSASCLPASVQSTSIHTAYSSHVLRTPKSAA
jgi:hypothetical protein